METQTIANMLTSKDQIKLFLEKVDLIRWKYDEVLHQSRHKFNIFSLLRNEDDEVKLHSRFLFELLNPRGTHQQGSIFLDPFLQQAGILEFELRNVYVEKERNNIDIFVANDTQAIIIENKIHASDQERQLERYYQATRQEGFSDIWILYLTLDGSDPSEDSVGTLSSSADNLITTISYRDDINAWLDKCIKEVALYSVLRETFVQYQRLIRKLTGQSLMKGYIMEIKELLVDETNIKLAIDISQALPEAKIDIQFNFWEELKEELAARDYKIVDVDQYSYSREKVEKFYRDRKNPRYYGILVEIVNLGMSSDLLFYIEIDWNIFCGFSVYENGDWANCKEEKFDYLADIIQGIDNNFNRIGHSIGRKYPKQRLDFKSFNDEEVFALADISKRASYVKELVDEISDIVDRFMEAYNSRENK